MGHRGARSGPGCSPPSYTLCPLWPLVPVRRGPAGFGGRRPGPYLRGIFNAKESVMKLTASIIAVALLAAVGASDAEAHWRPFRHRHPHAVRRRIILVGAPVHVRNVRVVDGKPRGTPDFHVDPSTTEVYVDGRLRGTADDFDGSPQKLHLVPGPHT